MAKVLFGAFVTDMRNKVQGTVFSRNRYGSYVRNNAVPTNPQSPRQAAQRSQFAALSSSWRTLTDAQRQSWINGTSNFSSVDVFGNARTLSGMSLFMELNMNLYTLGSAPLAVCPNVAKQSAFAVTAVVADASAGTVVITADAVVGSNPDDSYIVWATPMLSPGISFAKNLLRFITDWGGVVDGPSTLAVGTDYVAAFGAMTAGQRLVVGVKTINNVTGQASPLQVFDTIVVP